MFIGGFQRLLARGHCSRQHAIGILYATRPVWSGWASFNLESTFLPLTHTHTHSAQTTINPPGRRGWLFLALFAGGQDVTRGVGDHICRALGIGPTDLEDPALLPFETPTGPAGYVRRGWGWGASVGLGSNPFLSFPFPCSRGLVFFVQIMHCTRDVPTSAS